MQDFAGLQLTLTFTAHQISPPRSPRAFQHLPAPLSLLNHHHHTTSTTSAMARALGNIVPTAAPSNSPFAPLYANDGMTLRFTSAEQVPTLHMFSVRSARRD